MEGGLDAFLKNEKVKDDPARFTVEELKFPEWKID